jgi:hypothetical protein
MRGSRQLALALVVLAVIFAAVAIFYFTTKTSFLAGGHPAKHFKHAILFTALAVLSLIAANFARPKSISA